MFLSYSRLIPLGIFRFIFAALLLSSPLIIRAESYCASDNSFTLTTASQCPSPYSVFKDIIAGTVYAACYDEGVISISGSVVTTIVSSTQCQKPNSVFKDTVSGIVYVTCFDGGVLSVSGTSVTTVANSTQCPNPNGVFIDTLSRVVYAACQYGGVLSISGSSITTILNSTQCPNPVSVFKDILIGVVYVACSGGGVISILDTSVTTIANSTQCPSPNSVFKDTSNGIVYAACFGGGVISIYGSLVTTIATSTQCPNPRSVYKDTQSEAVFASCNAGGIISITDSSIITIVTSAQCPSPISSFKDVLKGALYAACSDGIIVISGLSVTTIATSPRCPSPTNVIKDMMSGIVYATCSNDGVISVSGSSLITLANSNQCQSPQSVFKDTITGIVYAACYDGGVISISSSVVTTIATSSQCPNPYSVIMDSQSGIAYAACVYGGVISISDSLITVVANLTQCPSPRSVFKDTFSGIVYAACYEGGVISISGSLITTIANSTQCLNPTSVFKDSLSGIVYVACYGGGVISILDTSVTTIANSTQCPSPNSVFKDTSNGIVYAACFGGGVISIYGSLVTTIATSTQCPAPSDLFKDPLRGILYATCFEGATIAVNFNFDCPEGYEWTFGGVCTPCSLGTFGDGRGSCVNCPPGTSSSPDGRHCVPCLVGRYASGVGTASCATCSSNSYAPTIGSTQCISCTVDGLICNDGDYSVSAGYWGYLVMNVNAVSIAPVLNSTGRVEIRTSVCPGSYCVGGNTIALLSPLNSIADCQSSICSIDSAAVTSNLLGCALHRDPSPDNFLCGRCKLPFAEWNHSCVDCNSFKIWLFFVWLAVSCSMVALLYQLSKQIRSDVKILLYFLQNVMFQLGQNNDYVVWLNISNFDLSASSGSFCIGHLTEWQQMALAIGFPFLMLLELLCGCGLHKITPWICRLLPFMPLRFVTFQDDNEQTQDSRGSYVRTALSILMFGYIQIISTCIRFLYCVEVNGHTLVFFTPSISCSSPTYRILSPFVWILLFAVGVGIPLGAFIKLFLKRSYHSDSSFKNWYGVLYESYRIEMWYWQSVVLIRQGILVSVGTFLQSNHLWLFVFFGIFNFLVFTIHTIARPNRVEKENGLEYISLFLLVGISYVLISQNPPYTDAQHVAILLLLLPFVFTMILVIAARRLPKIPFFMRINSFFEEQQKSKPSKDIEMTEPK